MRRKHGQGLNDLQENSEGITGNKLTSARDLGCKIGDDVQKRAFIPSCQQRVERSGFINREGHLHTSPLEFVVRHFKHECRLVVDQMLSAQNCCSCKSSSYISFALISFSTRSRFKGMLFFFFLIPHLHIYRFQILTNFK